MKKHFLKNWQTSLLFLVVAYIPYYLLEIAGLDMLLLSSEWLKTISGLIMFTSAYLFPFISLYYLIKSFRNKEFKKRFYAIGLLIIVVIELLFAVAFAIMTLIVVIWSQSSPF